MSPNSPLDGSVARVVETPLACDLYVLWVRRDYTADRWLRWGVYTSEDRAISKLLEDFADVPEYQIAHYVLINVTGDPPK